MIGGEWKENTNKMINPRLLELARTTGNKDLPKEKTKPKPTTKNVTIPEDPFILTFNEYGRELIIKSNEMFKDTNVEINLEEDNEEVKNMYILKRLALTTTIYRNKQLQGLNLWPATPLQSEQLLKENK